MSKNKNKNRNNQQQNQVNKQPVSKPSLTDEQKVEIELKDDETKGLVISEGLEVSANLSNESGNKLADAESKEDINKYWNYIKEINKRFEALINKAEDEKNKTTKIREELEGSKKETETIKSDLRKKLEEFNKKDKEITEREFAIDNGEYTGVIKRLLDSLKDTEKKVFKDTEDLLKELSEFHKKNLEEFIQQHKENIEIEKQSSELKREKKKFEVEKKIFEEELKDEYENKYSEELKIKTVELERLQRKYIQLEENSNKLKQFFDDLHNAFDSTEPQEILIHQRFLTEELSKLKKELEERPEKQ
jgi:hypothetical protein